MHFHKRYCLPESIIITPAAPLQLHYEAEGGFFWSPVLVMLMPGAAIACNIGKGGPLNS